MFIDKTGDRGEKPPGARRDIPSLEASSFCAEVPRATFAKIWANLRCIIEGNGIAGKRG